jgi:hypothetical protein
MRRVPTICRLPETAGGDRKGDGSGEKMRGGSELVRTSLYNEGIPRNICPTMRNSPQWSVVTLSKRKMTMLLPRMSLHCMKILDCIVAVRINGTCESIDKGGDELNRGTMRRGQQDLPGRG